MMSSIGRSTAFLGARIGEVAEKKPRRTEVRRGSCSQIFRLLSGADQLD
jgi:hypothetical protein